MTGADPRNWMWAEACAMIERAEQMHRQFFQPGSAAAPAVSWEPPIDVFESEHDLLIVVALPGVDTQDIEISSQAGVLRRRGRAASAGGCAGYGHRAPGDPARALRTPHQAAGGPMGAQPVVARERLPPCST